MKKILLCTAKIEAGIPTAAAIVTLVAAQHAKRKRISMRRAKKTPKEREKRTGLTDIAPHGCPVHDIPIPHDGIDERHERGEASPEDEQTRACTPTRGFGEVPGERDRRGGKREEGEDGECVVRGRHFSSLGGGREGGREPERSTGRARGRSGGDGTTGFDRYVESNWTVPVSVSMRGDGG